MCVCVCVCLALVIQRAMRMRYIVTLQYISTLSHKRLNYRQNVIKHKMRVFYFLYNFSLKHFSLRTTERDMIKYV